jgi:plasmid stability protein
VARIAIRNLDESRKSRLRVQVAAPGRSMADKTRDCLRPALNREVVPHWRPAS